MPDPLPDVASFSVPPLFAALARSRSVLIAGAGGGFDIYAGLPVAIALARNGVRVHLANLSFAQLELLDLDTWLDETVAEVTPDTAGLDDYFPERTLARWLAAHDMTSTVYAFAKTGVQPLRAAYRRLIEHLAVDAIVLVDGGTDILMRGDEAGLGTPVEDITSLAAVAGIDIPTKVVTCVGFGIDSYHGVRHTQVLENIAALDRAGVYLRLGRPGGQRPIPRSPGEHDRRASGGAEDRSIPRHGHGPDRQSIPSLTPPAQHATSTARGTSGIRASAARLLVSSARSERNWRACECRREPDCAGMSGTSM